VFESSDLNSTTLQEALLNFDQANAENKQFAFVVKTGSNHFAKVLVKSNGSRLLQGTAPDRFVDLEISYQNGANIPYAGVATSNDSPKKPFSRIVN
jgi:hypothetical protein